MTDLSIYNNTSNNLEHDINIYLIHKKELIIVKTFLLHKRKHYQFKESEIMNEEAWAKFVSEVNPYMCLDYDIALKKYIEIITPKEQDYTYGLITHKDPDHPQMYRSVHYKGKLIGFYRGQSCTKVYYSCKSNSYFELTKDKGKCSTADLLNFIPLLETLPCRANNTFGIDITFLEDPNSLEKIKKNLL